MTGRGWVFIKIIGPFIKKKRLKLVTWWCMDPHSLKFLSCVRSTTHVGIKGSLEKRGWDLCRCSNNRAFFLGCYHTTRLMREGAWSKVKVSQMPSGGWSDFDSQPITFALHADVQHLGPDCFWIAFSDTFLTHAEGCWTNQMDEL